MKSPDVTKIVDGLRDAVASINLNFTMAVAFHETWKPAAFDADLHQRMGRSYASQSFLVIKAALRREMLLALMRIWDAKTSSGLRHIFAVLESPDVWNEIVNDRVCKFGLAGVELGIATDLDKKRKAALQIFQRYSKGGDRHAALRSHARLRNIELAHTQARPADATPIELVDHETNELFEDTAEIAHSLLSIVAGTAIDYADVNGVYAHYARYFWASAHGERTEGHPQFHPPAVPHASGE
jgi:hypothetical protein